MPFVFRPERHDSRGLTFLDGAYIHVMVYGKAVRNVGEGEIVEVIVV